MSNNISSNSNSELFGKRVLELVPDIYPYVKHRLYTVESTGIVPRNMYKSSGIIDDALVNLFEEADHNLDDRELKLRLFSLVSNRLDALYKDEAIHKDMLSTSELLNKELEKFEEVFEIDIDNDLLMKDELTDISYHQHDDDQSMILYSDAENNIIKTLEITDTRGDLSEEKRIVLNKIYNWLPFETSNILDLFVFGNLTYDEIASIKGLTREEVKNTLQTVSKSLRKNLN
ncbi:MAG: sigma-70 family RNA polymerase sigma factor [Flavobacteriaceae bacterium]|nr:sigma-70 family RNA polymerase sigma factor [Flavobacteriaceae bacterium]